MILPHLIAARAAKTPDRPFVQDVGGRTLTFAAAHHEILQWADAFARLDVSAGENVITVMPARSEAYSIWLGLSWLRAIEVPINTGYRGRALEYVITNSRARVAVVSERYLAHIAGIANELQQLDVLVVPDATGPLPEIGSCRVLAGSRVLDTAPPAHPPEGPEWWDTACMIYTSGTTGPSKGVLVPWGEMHQFPAAVPHLDRFDEHDCLYAYWPVYHVAGKGQLYAVALVGCRMALRETFSPRTFWADVRSYGCTGAALLPTMALMLLGQPEQPSDRDNPLRVISVGPVIEQIDEFKERFGVSVYTGYGMTEIGAPLASEDHDVSFANHKSCGKVRRGYPGYECRVVDEHDKPLGPGSIGELIVRSDAPWVLNQGYFGMPDKTAEAWRNGWFHTGDAFTYDEDGNFYFVDRLKDAIRRRGENISSFEVEAYIGQHPLVADCAAVGVPSELGEEDVMVFVVTAPGSTLHAESLIEFLIPSMPRFMIPRYVEFIDSLPKTDATLRTRKATLRERGVTETTWDRERAGVEIPK